MDHLAQQTHSVPRVANEGQAAGALAYETRPTRRLLPRLNSRAGFRVATWNVLSLQSAEQLTQLSRELDRLQLSIVGLSETRRRDTARVSSGGYTYWWSGRSPENVASGVGIAVRNDLVPAIAEFTPVSERILQLRVRHSTGFLTFIVVYAPTEDKDAATKEEFYSLLDSVVAGCRKRDTLVVLGDFNAVVGKARDGYSACLGPEGYGTRNDNGSRLLDFAKSYNLLIGGSWFQRPLTRRLTWYSRDGVTRKELDHILVSKRWKLLRNCRVFRSAEYCNTDHRLLVGFLKISFRSSVHRGIGNCKPTPRGLLEEAVSRNYARILSDRFAAPKLSEDPVVLWESFKTVVLDSASGCVGPTKRAKKCFISAETLDTIEARRQARLDGKRDLYRALDRDRKTALRRDREKWVQQVAGEVESCLWSSNLRPAFAALRTLRSRPRPSVGLVRAADGSVPQDERGQLDCWKEHFERLLSASTPDQEFPDGDLQYPEASPDISTEPPSAGEIRRALGKLKNGKVPGICGVTAEMLKAGGEAVILQLEQLFRAIWHSGVCPPDWYRGLIVPVWKGKGDNTDCNNYRGITLLSIPGKLFARVLLERIRNHLLRLQRPEQSGFTPKKSTVDRILALRILAERRREYRQPLFAAYVDLKKAFDSLDREALKKVLRLRGIPQKIIDMIDGLYSTSESAVRLGPGKTSAFFPVLTGVKQGCVLAPNLFTPSMDWILSRTVNRSNCGAGIGDVQITDLDFADDCVFLAEVMDILSSALSVMAEEARPLGLEISWTKTKVQCLSDFLCDMPAALPVVDEKISLVDSFLYLGSTISSDCRSDPDVYRRLGLASSAMNGLDEGVWRCRYLSINTKLRIFRCIVMPVLLYGSETWTLTKQLLCRLDAFGTRGLRRILGLRWDDFVRNTEVLRVSGEAPVSTQIRKRRLALFGHVARLPESDPCRRLLSSRTPETWVRPRGRPRATWHGQLVRDLELVGMDWEAAWRLAMEDPSGWRRVVREATRHQVLQPAGPDQ